jgi:hypothetical protein
MYEDKLRKAENDSSELSNIKDQINEKDKEINMLKLQTQNLNSDKEVLGDKIKKLEKSIEGLEKIQQTAVDTGVGNPAADNENMLKLEKLGKMKELGIVTEEEFNTFKQKFLNEM